MLCSALILWLAGTVHVFLAIISKGNDYIVYGGFALAYFITSLTMFYYTWKSKTNRDREG